MRNSGDIAPNLAAENARRRSPAPPEEAERATEERRRADYRLYLSEMSLGQQAWQEGLTELARQHLDAHVPKAAGDTDPRGFEWYYLERLCRPELRTFRGHLASVRAVAFSPDRRLIATAGNDGAVRVWDVAGGREVALPARTHRSSQKRGVFPRRPPHRLRGRGRYRAALGYRQRRGRSWFFATTSTRSTASHIPPTAAASPPPAKTVRSSSGMPPRARLSLPCAAMPTRSATESSARGDPSTVMPSGASTRTEPAAWRSPPTAARSPPPLGTAA